MSTNRTIEFPYKFLEYFKDASQKLSELQRPRLGVMKKGDGDAIEMAKRQIRPLDDATIILHMSAPSTPDHSYLTHALRAVAQWFDALTRLSPDPRTNIVEVPVPDFIDPRLSERFERYLSSLAGTGRILRAGEKIPTTTQNGRYANHHIAICRQMGPYQIDSNDGSRIIQASNSSNPIVCAMINNPPPPKKLEAKPELLKFGELAKTELAQYIEKHQGQLNEALKPEADFGFSRESLDKKTVKDAFITPTLKYFGLEGIEMNLGNEFYKVKLDGNAQEFFTQNEFNTDSKPEDILNAILNPIGMSAYQSARLLRQANNHVAEKFNNNNAKDTSITNLSASMAMVIETQDGYLLVSVGNPYILAFDKKGKPIENTKNELHVNRNGQLSSDLGCIRGNTTDGFTAKPLSKLSIGYMKRGKDKTIALASYGGRLLTDKLNNPKDPSEIAKELLNHATKTCNGHDVDIVIIKPEPHPFSYY